MTEEDKSGWGPNKVLQVVRVLREASPLDDEAVAISRESAFLLVSCLFPGGLRRDDNVILLDRLRVSGLEFARICIEARINGIWPAALWPADDTGLASKP